MSEPEQDYLLPDEWNGRAVCFHNHSTGNVLDLGTGMLSFGFIVPSLNGNPVTAREFTGSGAQQWRLEKVDSGAFGAWVIRNVGAGTVLDLSCGSVEDCTLIQGCEYVPGTLSQEWLIITKGYNDASSCILQNTASYTAAAVLAAGNQNYGALVVGYQRAGPNGNQLWRMQIV